MQLRLAHTVALLLTMGGCAPFMELPQPDPIWSATAGPFFTDTTQPPINEDLSLRQLNATERARAYIVQSLPARVDAFIKALEGQSFFCSLENADHFSCVYSKAQPWRPCVTSTRVSIEVAFPYDSAKLIVISEKDIDVAAFVVADHEHVDNRGCLPL